MRDATWIEQDDATGYWDVWYVVSIGMSEPYVVSSWSTLFLAELYKHCMFQQRQRLIWGG